MLFHQIVTNRKKVQNMYFCKIIFKVKVIGVTIWVIMRKKMIEKIFISHLLQSVD